MQTFRLVHAVELFVYRLYHWRANIRKYSTESGQYASIERD
jgi:hypothetical protein